MGLRCLLFATYVSVFSFDYATEFPTAIRELAIGLVDGSIKRKFHIIEGGVEQAPVALPLLFSGGNTGKLLVSHRGRLDIWLTLNLR
jgi:NADPH-dependent curcumin reductase CurA